MYTPTAELNKNKYMCSIKRDISFSQQEGQRSIYTDTEQYVFRFFWPAGVHQKIICVPFRYLCM